MAALHHPNQGTPIEISLDFQVKIKTALLSSQGESQKQSHSKPVEVTSHSELAQPAGKPPHHAGSCSSGHHSLSLSLFPPTLGVFLSSCPLSFKVSTCPTGLLTLQALLP